MIASLTPPQLAKRYGVNADKIHAWIKAGELRAIDVSQEPGGRPRWRITPEAIAEFEERRAAKPTKKPTRRRRKKADPDYIEYV